MTAPLCRLVLVTDDVRACAKEFFSCAPQPDWARIVASPEGLDDLPFGCRVLIRGYRRAMDPLLDSSAREMIGRGGLQPMTGEELVRLLDRLSMPGLAGIARDSFVTGAAP